MGSANNIFRDGLYNNGLYLFRTLDIDEDEIRLLAWHWWDCEKKRVVKYSGSIQPIKLDYENRLLLTIHVEQSLLALKFDKALLEKLVAIELDYKTGTPNFGYHNALGLIHYE